MYSSLAEYILFEQKHIRARIPGSGVKIHVRAEILPEWIRAGILAWTSDLARCITMQA